MADYNSDLQSKLLSIGATHAGLAINTAIPSLGLLSSTYGHETPIEWLVIQLDTLNNFAEVKSKISDNQIYELAELILAEYYYLNAAEILFFLARFKTGHYGTFYGAIDPMKITCGLIQYVAERHKDIDRYEREQDRLQREDKSVKYNKLRVSYTEYQELKRRAEAGDEEAKRLLTPPNDMNKFSK